MTDVDDNDAFHDIVSSKMDILGDLDLNALARFAVVVERGGFSQAARALGVPRQSIHRSIAQLEDAAGVLLLDRTGRHVRATDVGRRIFVRASTILREARDARASLVAAKRGPRGRLRLTAPHLFAEEFLAGPIIEFLAAWPEVEIEADWTVSSSDLVRDDLDLAVRVGERPTRGYATALGVLSQVCCAAPSYLERAADLLRPEDLVAHVILEYGRRKPHARWRFERDRKVVDVELTPRLRTDSAPILLASCRAGLGVTWLPEFLCARDLADGSLVRVCAEWTLPVAPVWVLTASRATKSPTLRAFIELLQARIRDERLAPTNKDDRTAMPPRR